jgi:hypothetical protein
LAQPDHLLYQRVEYRLAKVWPITACEQRNVLSAIGEILTVVVRGPRESPGERAREGHEARSLDVLGVSSCYRT